MCQGIDQTRILQAAIRNRDAQMSIIISKAFQCRRQTRNIEAGSTNHRERARGCTRAQGNQLGAALDSGIKRRLACGRHDHVVLGRVGRPSKRSKRQARGQSADPVGGLFHPTPGHNVGSHARYLRRLFAWQADRPSNQACRPDHTSHLISVKAVQIRHLARGLAPKAPICR